MKHYSERITINAQTRFGKPTIRGMRISVYDILGWFASGMTAEDIMNDFPELTLLYNQTIQELTENYLTD